MLVAPVILAWSFWLPTFAQEPPEVPRPIVIEQEGGQGELTVSVEGNEIFGSIPRGASRVKMVSVHLSASCENDVVLESIDVKHVGLGERSDITSVYLGDVSRRISRSLSLSDRNRTAQLRLKNFTIKKCDGVRLFVYADFARDADTAAEHGLALVETNIVSSARKTIINSAPAMTKVNTVPKEAGTITVNYLPVAGRLNYGTLQTIARLQLSNDSVSDQMIKKITLRNDGTARDLEIVRMYFETSAGQVISDRAARMHGKQVTLTFPAFVLSRSATRVLILKGEIRGSSLRTINFALEEPADLETKAVQER